MSERFEWLRERVSRMKAWCQGHRRALIEHGKTVLIAGLFVSAVFLSGKAGLFGGAANLAAWRGRVMAVEAPETGMSKQEYTEVAQPLAVAVCLGDGGRYATAYSQETKTVYERFAAYLGEALGSAGVPEIITRTQWEKALSDRGIYFDYVREQSLLCVGAWQGISVPESIARHEARQLFLAVESGGVRLYYRSADNGNYYRCTTALTKTAVESRMEIYQPGQAVFAFEQPIDSGLDPNALLVPDMGEVRTVMVSNPGVPQMVEETMLLFGMNYITATSYSESDGGAVYLDGSSTLRLSGDGAITFERGGVSGGTAGRNGEASLPEVIDGLYQTTLRLTEGRGEGQIRLTEAIYEEDGETYTVRFDYFIDGMPVCLTQGSAAEYTVSHGKILRAQVYLRQYHFTGETQTALPTTQAAALVAACGGRELVRVYEDSGESVTVSWLIGSLTGEEH